MDRRRSVLHLFIIKEIHAHRGGRCTNGQQPFHILLQTISDVFGLVDHGFPTTVFYLYRFTTWFTTSVLREISVHFRPGWSLFHAVYAGSCLKLAPWNMVDAFLCFFGTKLHYYVSWLLDKVTLRHAALSSFKRASRLDTSKNNHQRMRTIIEMQCSPSQTLAFPTFLVEADGLELGPLLTAFMPDLCNDQSLHLWLRCLFPVNAILGHHIESMEPK